MQQINDTVREERVRVIATPTYPEPQKRRTYHPLTPILALPTSDARSRDSVQQQKKAVRVKSSVILALPCLLSLDSRAAEAPPFLPSLPRLNPRPSYKREMYLSASQTKERETSHSPVSHQIQTQRKEEGRGQRTQARWARNGTDRTGKAVGRALAVVDRLVGRRGHPFFSADCVLVGWRVSKWSPRQCPWLFVDGWRKEGREGKGCGRLVGARQTRFLRVNTPNPTFGPIFPPLHARRREGHVRVALREMVRSQDKKQEKGEVSSLDCLRSIFSGRIYGTSGFRAPPPSFSGTSDESSERRGRGMYTTRGRK